MYISSSTAPMMDALPIYNILVLGPTQSGKSTFIECVKQYADPSYAINESRTGTGNWTLTQEVRSEVVTTNLPIYKLYSLDVSDEDWEDSNDEGREVDIDAKLSQSSIKPFKKLLGRDEDIETRPETVPGSEWARFRFIDTPGLDDTNGNDIRNLAKIFEALSTVDKFHLVLIVDSNKTFSKSLVEAFETYFHLFEELNSLTMILHTHVPNINRHPSKTKLPLKLKERSELFRKISGREMQVKMIDCNLDDPSPVDTCLTRNTIREILEIAKIKSPVPRLKTFVCKTPKMVAVESVIREKFRREIESIHASCEALDKIDRLSIDIHNTERNIDAMIMAVETFDTDEPETLYETRFEEKWTFFGTVEDRNLKFEVQDFTITKKAVAQQSMYELDENGGKGHNFWNLRFARKSFRSGYYHVILSTTSRLKHRKAIEDWQSTIDAQRRSLESQKEQKSVLESIVQNTVKRNDTLEAMEQLKFRLGFCVAILDHVVTDTLPMCLFLELANADVYQDSNILESAQALENHFERVYRHKPKLLLQGSWADHIAASV